MKTRSGVDDAVAFGPPPGGDTIWTLTTKNGQTLQSWGETAYKACSNVGLTLGQIASISCAT